MEEAIVVNKGEDLIDLPPGFRFHPTDEEIITCYLTEKVVNSNFSASAIGEADLNKCEPWDLPKKAKMGRERMVLLLPERQEEELRKERKSNWVMHEYRLEGKFAYYNLPRAAKDEWVVCRVFHKNSSTGIKKTSGAPEGLLRMNSFGDDLLDCSSLPPLMDPPFSNTISGTSGLERQCKVEQFSSNQSAMVSRSQDTGLSTDMNAEISSVVSKQDVGSNRSYDDLDGPSIGPIADLDCLWDY
ncbi:hypothetical protein SLA2020_495600 [Shorea laevis]